MWTNASINISSSGSESATAGVPIVQTTTMSKYVDYFYRQPTLPTYVTHYTYYDYLVVIDFEATCDDTRNDNPRPIRHEMPEIIQFPAILLNVRTMEVEDIFNYIVKPVEDPVLSEFCTCLTGITQSMVKKAPTFPTVLRRFEGWLKSHGIALNNQEYGHTFAIVTDGSYDMGHFMYKQCIISQIPYPAYANRWVNIRTIFTKAYRRRWVCLKAALEFLRLSFEGRAHNGLDDAKNICKVLQHLLRGGCVVYQTEKILLQPGEQERNEARILSDKSAGKYDLATVAPVFAKEYEHISVYATDVWTSHRCVAPEVTYDNPVETEPSTDSYVTISPSDYCSPLQQEPVNTGSCESIASGCSNKENNIPDPMYIPKCNPQAIVAFKSRSSVTKSDGNDSSNVGSSPGNGAATVVTSSGKVGRRKKKNAQLKDPGSNNGSAGNNCLSTSDGTNNVGNELNASGEVEVSHHSQIQTKPFDSDGSLTTHLQQLVSDLRTEE